MDNKFYTVHPIDGHTWRIADIFGDYMYLVEGNDRAALIDTGMGFSGLAQVVGSLTDKPVIVLCTHGHLDHVGANGQFEQVYIHPADEGLLREHGSQAYREERIPAFAAELASNAGGKVIQGLFPDSGDIVRVIHDLIHVSQPETLNYLQDGQTIDLGGRSLEVISVPGHTRGSVCFLDAAGRQLFSGDMLCTMGIMLSFECSTTVNEFLETMAKMKARTEGKVDHVYGGHHVAPIGPEYMDKYISCGRKLLECSDGSITENGTFGTFYRYNYEDIGLTYTEETLR